jgi:chemotaxis protein MotB
MPKEKIIYEGTPAGSWMVTFSDMNTLLLTFFVLLFSMATIATDKFDEIFQTQEGDGLGLLDEEGTTYSSSIIYNPLPLIERGARVSLLEAFSTTEDLVNENIGLPDGVEIDISDGISGKITITLADRILFPPGETEISATNRELLEKLRLFIQKIIAIAPRRMIVEGHSDNRPPKEERFTISARRAHSVLEVLLADGILPPSLFTIVGYGDTKPVAPNNSDANRAVNRRVRVILEPPETEIRREDIY